MQLDKEVRQPLFVSLFHVALPHMKAYQSDLGHDALSLADAKPGELYFWSWRESGTHMMLLNNREQVQQAISVIRGGFCPHEAWHILKITGNRHGHADGTLTRIGDKDPDVVIRRLQGIIEAEAGACA